jgi:anti-anti-sigma regulatory factor
MPLHIRQEQARVTVTVLEIHGDLDYSNYIEVLDGAREAYAAGSRHLLIDLTDVPFMGSSGLVALHGALLIMSGQEPPDPEAGWQAFHSLGQGPSEDQTAVKLLGLGPRVEQMLERTALLRFFQTFTDRAEAMASF